MRKANRILALGLNPAYQKTILFDHLRLGAVNRSAESYAVASGKGINFTRAVRTWGHAGCVVLQPLGGVIGELVASGLAAEGIPAVTVPVKSCTRTCSTLLCGTAGTATEVIEPAAPLSRQEYDRLFEALEKQLRAKDALLAQAESMVREDIVRLRFLTEGAAEQDAVSAAAAHMTLPELLEFRETLRTKQAKQCRGQLPDGQRFAAENAAFQVKAGGVSGE